MAVETSKTVDFGRCSITVDLGHRLSAANMVYSASGCKRKAPSYTCLFRPPPAEHPFLLHLTCAA